MNTSQKIQAAKTIHKAKTLKKDLTEKLTGEPKKSKSLPAANNLEEIASERKSSHKHKASFNKEKPDVAPVSTAVSEKPVSAPTTDENVKQLIYIFIARDADMFVYEQHLEHKVQMAKF